MCAQTGCVHGPAQSNREDNPTKRARQFPSAATGRERRNRNDLSPKYRRRNNPPSFCFRLESLSTAAVSDGSVADRASPHPFPKHKTNSHSSNADGTGCWSAARLALTDARFLPLPPDSYLNSGSTLYSLWFNLNPDFFSSSQHKHTRASLASEAPNTSLSAAAQQLPSALTTAA